MKVNLG